MPRIDEVDLDPGLAGLVELVDDRRVDQRVHLRPDAPALPARTLAISRSISPDNLVAQVVRRHVTSSSAARLDIAGDVVEDVGDVAADPGIGGEEAEIGVDARRDRMVIAGAEVAIGAVAAFLAAHHHRHLGVGLPLDEAVDDLDAGALERARPHQILLLVEAGLQFDHRGHRFAGLGGGDQRIDHRGLLAGAVERLLDRDDVRVLGRLAEDLDSVGTGGRSGVGHHVPQLEDALVLAQRFEERARGMRGHCRTDRGAERATEIPTLEPVMRDLGQMASRLCAAQRRRFLEGLGDDDVEPTALARQHGVGRRLREERMTEGVPLDDRRVVGDEELGGHRFAERLVELDLGETRNEGHEVVVHATADDRGDPEQLHRGLRHVREPGGEDLAKGRREPPRLGAGREQLLGEERVSL